MVNGKDVPNKMLKTNVIPASKGHVGVPIDSGVEGSAKYSGKDSIGTNSVSSNNKKTAGHIGATNQSHA